MKELFKKLKKIVKRFLKRVKKFFKNLKNRIKYKKDPESVSKKARKKIERENKLKSKFSFWGNVSRRISGLNDFSIA